MLSNLWATYEMDFWERKIHGALECNLTFLTWQLGFGATRMGVWNIRNPEPEPETETETEPEPEPEPKPEPEPEPEPKK